VRFGKTDSGAQAVADLITFCMVSGLLDRDDWLDINAVRLITLSKGDGRARPIGIGHGLARVLMGVNWSRDRSGVARKLHRDNYTLQPNGMSVVIGSVQCGLEHGLEVQSRDVSNAFNTVSAAAVGERAKALGLPNAAAIFGLLTMYRVEKDGDSFLATCLNQGSSYSSGGMAMYMDACLASVRATGALVMGVADDITALSIPGSPEHEALTEALTKALTDGGLTENQRKRLMFGDGHDQSGKVLGVHIGPDRELRVYEEFETIAARIGRLAAISCEVSDSVIPRRQVFLRCLALNLLPAVVHLVRHHPVELTREGALLVDIAVRHAVEAVFSLSSHESISIERQLVLSGPNGVGLSSAELAAPIARLGCILATCVAVRTNVKRVQDIGAQPLFGEFDELVATVVTQLGLKPESGLGLDIESARKIITSDYEPTEDEVKALKTAGRRLRDEYNATREKAWRDSIPVDDLVSQNRVASTSAREGHCRVFAKLITKIPVNQVSDKEFNIGFRRHLGLPVLPVDAAPCGKCGEHLDSAGEHMLKCRYLGRGPNHDATKKSLRRELQKLEKYSDIKVSNLEPELDQFKKESVRDEKVNRADIGMCEATKRKTTLIDVRTCTLERPESNADVGVSVKKGEVEKQTKYGNRYEFPEGYVFVACAIDSHGRWGECFSSFMTDTYAKATGSDKALYNLLISGARDAISVANFRAVTRRIAVGLESCVTCPRDRVRLSTRDYRMIE
jgi:hypothetical protein